MKYIKWIGWLSALLLVYSCFIPWVVIESLHISVSGIDSEGTDFGKPGYIHFILAGFFLVFHSINRLWAKRWNLLIVALNIAWLIRNFFILTTCAAGECPVKKTGLWLAVISSVLMLISALFPDMKISKKNEARDA